MTDTFEKLDTLTINSSLVSDSSKLFDLLSKIAGTNFLKVPYEYVFLLSYFTIKYRINWDEDRKYFSTRAPLWFEPYEINSLATWLTYFFERTLWIQYYANVKGEFKNIRD